MRDEPSVEDAEAPPPPGTNKIEITVGGHTVAIESSAPLNLVADYAMALWDRTADEAKQLPFGFDATGGQFERAEPYIEPSGMERWEETDERAVDGQSAKDGTTRRLVIEDPARHHRPGLGSVPMDRGWAPVPGTRH
jgi:hypothetical protein